MHASTSQGLNVSPSLRSEHVLFLYYKITLTFLLYYFSDPYVN